ncbi:MAG: alpha/beta fold hydrolase [Deltaproteobacteria bacterium]|nr:alpha/beta fold hydrolase [Deltaproteobacteria bacterium]
MEITRVFIHGLESSSAGTKGLFFSKRYPGMIVEDYPGAFGKRMAKLENLLAGKDNLIIVGSSYGGLMAAVFACRHQHRLNKLILLAPALNLEEFSLCRALRIQLPVTVIHGTGDTVVPLAEVRSIAEDVFLNLAYQIVDDDHSLHRTFPLMDWNELLHFSQ